MAPNAFKYSNRNFITENLYRK